MRRLLTLILCGVASVGVVACGDDDERPVIIQQDDDGEFDDGYEFEDED